MFGNTFTPGGNGENTSLLFLPVAQYIHANPLTSNPAYPYICTLDKTKTTKIIYAIWAFLFTGINDASNYWEINLILVPSNAVIDKQYSYNFTAGWTTIKKTLNYTIPATENLIYISMSKSGIPGAAYASPPLTAISFL